MFDKPALADLKNESDVEQKFVYPLLTSSNPSGFGIERSVVHTKQNIRKFQIGKGLEAKVYFPDYLITQGGFPIAIIEAKTPGSDIHEAFREARLYAAELNAIFPTGLNPLTRIMSTDGHMILAGYYDQSQPTVTATYDQITSHSLQMHQLQMLFGSVELKKCSIILFNSVKPKTMVKARLLLGGLATQLEEVSLNSFGSTISADFAHIFNPTTRLDRIRIARDGYVNSARRQRYLGAIDRVIRASVSISESHSQTIVNTAQPHELIASFQNRQLEHQVLLIIGSVGSGKSTFIDYLQEVALPLTIKDVTVWVHLNMNSADISPNGIFDWVRKEVVAGLRHVHAGMDFDELTTLKKVYSIEVNRFSKGVGQLYKNSATFDERLAEIIFKADNELESRMVNMCRFCGSERGKLIVVVMDNCDKRLRDEQLLMFQVAEWLQKSFRVLVILPLREETFDNHRNEPPLDTVLKDMVFRIEPASFQEVLDARIQMAMAEITKEPNRQKEYYTPNGIRVEINGREQSFYLQSILRSVFEHSRQIRDLIIGLAGRNLRLALEIFEEFCTSGYLTEDHIFQMRKTEGRYVLPLEVSLAVLLRRGRRFYDSDHAYLKSLCVLEARDERPNYFTRLLVLNWLALRLKAVGTRGLIGYFPLGEMETNLSVYGVDQAAVRRETEYLASAHCVISEDFRIQGLQEQDLICLGPAGVAHLEMMGNPHFWAAIAEDTWVEDRLLAEAIAKRISTPESQHRPKTVYENAQAILFMLGNAYRRELIASQAILDESKLPLLIDLTKAFVGLDALERQLIPMAWIGADTRFQVGQAYPGRITNTRDYGVFVELEPGVSGLAHVSKLPRGFLDGIACAYGSLITVKILTVDKLDQRMELEWVSSIQQSC